MKSYEYQRNQRRPFCSTLVYISEIQPIKGKKNNRREGVTLYVGLVLLPTTSVFSMMKASSMFFP